MSRAAHLFAGTRYVPAGYGSSEGRCLPCSGVSGKVACVSPRSSCRDYKGFSQGKIVSLRCSSRTVSTVCNASSSSHRRNPDFPRQNRHGFSRSRKWQNEERDGSEDLEESNFVSSKNGPLLSVSGSPKFQATATPGSREKEIVELFRKVQAQLRERAATKEENKVENAQGQRKENETVDSLLKLLRKHSVQGKKSNNSVQTRDALLDQPEQSGSSSEDKREKSKSLSDLKNVVKHDVQEGEGPSVTRPPSVFQRRSPVPRIKFESIYSGGDSEFSSSHTNLDDNGKQSNPEPECEREPKLELKSEQEIELDNEASFSDGEMFHGIAEVEASDFDEGDTEGEEEGEGEAEEEEEDEEEEEEENSVQIRDLSALKLPELRAIAKSRGLKGFSKLKKGELVELLIGGPI